MEGDVLRFSRFRLVPGARQLFCEDLPVFIGGRAFDLLTALVRKRGQVLTKEEIISQVWPTTFVGDCNLRCQISGLRKALGDDGDAIKTINGRGYMMSVEAVSDFKISAQANDTSTAPAESGIEADKPTIVLIGDDSLIREAIEDLLESAGIRAESFASVNSLQEAFAGYSLTRLLRNVRLSGCLPVVLVSGLGDIFVTAMVINAGTFELLTKPVSPVTLLDVIQEISVYGPHGDIAVSDRSVHHHWDLAVRHARSC
ncbi:winged helix-turn-helix domain-containing protein [Phyllobacterium sp. LjRoot231]|uniref:winged helix-turn-helix domain-containing protein n=1 Tax=Phyllobacterium sp. LjRoot231 TaxID=3342289 RepID=UPI003ED12007